MITNQDIELDVNAVMEEIPVQEVEEHVLIMGELNTGNIQMEVLNQLEDVIKMKTSPAIKAFIVFICIVCLFLWYENYQLEKKVDKMKIEYTSRIDSLQESTDAMQADISENSSRIDDVESTSEDLDGRVSDLEDNSNN